MNDDIKAPYPSTDWIQTSPRGENLPIPCSIPFSRGKAKPDPADLPEGWEEVLVACDDPELAEAGFEVAPLYINGETGRSRFGPAEGYHPVHFHYLRNPEGELVATWDEGRYWTPEESASWRTLLVGRGEFGQGRET